MKPIKQKKLLYQLLIYVLPLVALSVMVTSGVLSWTTSRYFKKNIQQNYRHILKSAVGEIGFFMNSALHSLESMGMIITAAKTDPWQTDIALAAFALKNSSFEVATLYDTDGEKIVSTNPEGEEMAVPDRPTFDKALTGKFGVSSVMVNKDHVPYVYLAVPVYQRGNIHAVLWGELNLTSVWYVLEDIRIGRTGQVYIMDLSGQVVGHREIDYVVTKPPGEKPLILEEVRASIEPIEWIETRDGRRNYALGAKIDNFDWVVVLSQDLPEIYEYLSQNIYWAIAMTLLVVLVAALLLWMNVRRFLRPLYSLHHRVREVGKGDLEQEIDIRGRDEVGDLARAFNGMLVSLKEHIQREIANARELTHARNLAVLGTAAGKVTHEVGNLINNIGMALLVLRNEVISERGQQSLSLLDKESDRVQHFIKNFLQFAKKPELKMEKRPLPGLLAEVCFAHQPAAEPRGIQIQLDCPKDLPPMAADHALLYQAVNNLLKNSLEAMGEGGRVSLGAQMENGDLVLTVADTGAGMTRETLEYLFEPFFTTKGKKGTGLGMAITQSIIQAHGGTIECHSELEVGTRFVVRLPVR